VSSQRVYALNNPGHGSYTARLSLECGHITHTKGSKEPMYKVRCPYCRQENPLQEQQAPQEQQAK
jgi:hypothetical protein